MTVGNNPYVIEHTKTIEFCFLINKSFLNAPSHPITIPKRYHPQLARYVRPNRHKIAFCTSNGKAFGAYIYYGIAGWGPYYQIRIPQKEYRIIVGDYYLDQNTVIELRLTDSTIIAGFLKATQKHA